MNAERSKLSLAAAVRPLANSLFAPPDRDSMNAWFESIVNPSFVLSTAAGALFGLVITIWNEWLRRPHLIATAVAEPTVVPAAFVAAQREGLSLQNEPEIVQQALFLHIALRNKPLCRCAFWATRGPAFGSKASIMFFTMGGIPVYERSMQGRWSSTPEPGFVRLPVVTPDFGEHTSTVVVPRLVTSRVDLYPGDAEKLDIVARLDDDPHCYGWNNESHGHRWRHPSWRLDRGQYLVRVVVTAGDLRKVFVFHLVCENDFRIREASNVPKSVWSYQE